MVRSRFILMVVIIGLALASAGAVAAAPIERYVLPGDSVFPEGIAYQASTGYFFVGSTPDGTIMRGHIGQPEAQVFLPGGGDGRNDARGLKVDSRGYLYVAGGTLGQLFVYDLATKQLLVKYATGVTPSFVNDVTIHLSGDAYFTDSNSPFIYRVPKDLSPGGLEKIDLKGTPIVYAQGFNLNGIASSADGKYLVTVQSNAGKLFRVEVATKAVTEIDLGGGTAAAGDGLWLDGPTLYAMRNSAQLLVTMTLTADFSKATTVSSDTNALFAFPTTFARAGNRFLVVSSQLDKRQANQQVPPFIIASIPVPGTDGSLPTMPAMPGLPNTGAGGGQGAAHPMVWSALLLVLIAMGGMGVRFVRRAG